MPFGPATTGRTRFDIGDLVRRHRTKLEAEVSLTLAQRRVLSAIALCRTAALGGHVELCRPCGYEHPAYYSCGNRHCPKCQALAQERWNGARSERLVPTRRFHVVFTLPGELRALAKRRPAPIFNALFRSAAASLLKLGQSRFSATLGITMVLHTWTRELLLHPHVHAIVPAGGLSLDRSRWVHSSPKYLVPVKVLGALLRGKMIAALRRLHAEGRPEDPNPLADPECFDRLIAALARRSWVVYAPKPFDETEHVLAYLGRYTHRVGIANSRLVDVTDDFAFRAPLLALPAGVAWRVATLLTLSSAPGRTRNPPSASLRPAAPRRSGLVQQSHSRRTRRRAAEATVVQRSRRRELLTIPRPLFGSSFRYSTRTVTFAV